MCAESTTGAKSHDVREIVNILGGSVKRVLGDTTRAVRRPAPIGSADAESVTFCSATGARASEVMAATSAGVVLCDEPTALGAAQKDGRTTIVTDRPRLAFIRVVEALFSDAYARGIDASAVVDKQAEIGVNVYIGPLATIGEHCRVGQGTTIHRGVHIYAHTKIGDNVTIHAGTVIGADGFGYERGEDGRFEKFPHLGGVVIENDVEIGANSCIDRGTLSPTLIREGAKIDNLVHIAHNVVVGRHAAVIAHAMIGGGTKIGDYAWIAPSACVRDGISIGDHATIGLGAVVTKNVPANATVMGAPARDAAEYKAILATLNNLPRTS